MICGAAGCAVLPFAPQDGEDAQGRPLALEPVGLDKARLATEPQAFEEPVDGYVAVVGLGLDAMDTVLLEQLADHGRERLGRQPGPLLRWCERDADLGGRRLIRDDAHGAIAAERPAASVDRGQLHPRARRAELDVSLRREKPLGVDHRVRRIPRLVPRDVRLAAIGDERREVVGAEWPQAQSLRDDLNHGRHPSTVS
jgi:hypothetical protein